MRTMKSSNSNTAAISPDQAFIVFKLVVAMAMQRFPKKPHITSLSGATIKVPQLHHDSSTVKIPDYNQTFNPFNDTFCLALPSYLAYFETQY